MTLTEQAKQYNRETKEALLTILGLLNKGQRSKLLKNPVAIKLFARYGIEVTE